MKSCPHCGKNIAQTAIRCRYCRRPLTERRGRRLKRVKRRVLGRLRLFDQTHRERVRVRTTLSEAVLLFVLAYVGSWALAERGIAISIVDALRQRFFVFTEEPLLQFYVYIFTETFILKTGLVVFICLIFALKELMPSGALGLGRVSRPFWNRGTSGFLVFCAMTGLIQGFDPLIPNLPTNLFFSRPAAIGNLLAAFSVLAIAPVTEEIFFRGFLYPIFAKKFGAAASIVITSLLFAGMHYPQMQGEYLWLGTILAGGLFMTWTRAVTGSTRYAIYLHMLYNGTITFLGILRFWTYGA